MQRRKFIGTLTATVSTVALAGCGGSESGDFEEGNDNGDTNSGGSSNDIEVISHKIDEYGPTENVGTEYKGESVGGSAPDYAEVEAKFYKRETLAELSLGNINR